LDSKSHWETVYRTKQANEVSWYQAKPTISLDLIRRTVPDLSARIIDIGGGASSLVDELLRTGYSRITVLDISPAALAQAQQRLKALTSAIHWLEADVLTAKLPVGAFDLWHDRAVFHFFTAPRDQHAYIDQVRRAVRPGGYVLVATFAEDGPSRCSGLPVARYSTEDLSARFGKSFELVESVREQHVTPAGVTQPFVYCLWRVAP
jgi:SAM-dependent methyltransferase